MESKYVLALNAAMSTLSLFLISPFCCCSLSRYKKVPQERYSMNLNSFLIRIIYRDIHTFISLGVLGEYAKSLFASSPCTHKSFPRTLEYVLILSAHTETILCTANNPDRHLLHLRLNTFRAISVGA
jgi:hypothetical protein